MRCALLLAVLLSPCSLHCRPQRSRNRRCFALNDFFVALKLEEIECSCVSSSVPCPSSSGSGVALALDSFRAYPLERRVGYLEASD